MQFEPPQDLKKAIADKTAVLVVGTGVSLASLKGSPAQDLAAWPGLLRHGLSRCREWGEPRLSDKDQDFYIGKLADNPELASLLDIASVVEKRLGAPNGGEYRSWLADALGTLSATDTAIIDALGAFDCPTATTNYDGLLHLVLKGDPVTWREPERIAAALRSRGRSDIIHFHGYYKQPESVVLGAASYERMASDPAMKMVREAVGTLGTFVFVGCGAAGLKDPDFGPFWDSFGAVLGKAGHRHYVLCRESEAQDPLGNLHWLPYGKDHSDLLPFLRGLAAPVSAPVVVRAVDPPHRLPPSPEIFLGRDEKRAQVVEALLEGEKVLVSGGPGIGKSTLCVAAIRDQRLVPKFGDRRWFADLDGAGESDSMSARIGLALGLPPDQRARAAVLYEIEQRVHAEHPAVLALDNLETPHDGDPAGCRDVLARLKDVPGLALLAGMRGHVRPQGVDWRRIFDLTRLDPPYDREVFLHHAGGTVGDESILPDLLKALDGLPLALRLMGRQAQHCPLPLLWEEWQDRRTELLKQGEGKDDNLAVSIDLSLKSRAMTPQARMLLGLLARLPDGIAAKDLRKVYHYGPQAAAILHQLALADWTPDKSRLHQLAPIRDHVRDAQELPPPKLLDPCIDHYLALAETAGKAGRDGGGDIGTRLEPDLANLEAMIGLALTLGAKQRREKAIRCAFHLGELSRFTGLCRPEVLLQKAAEAASRDSISLQADCLRQLGAMALTGDRSNAARVWLDQALAIHERHRSGLGEASCRLYLAQLDLLACRYAEAEAHVERARSLFHDLRWPDDEAHCLNIFGTLAMNRGKPAEAEHWFNAAEILAESALERGHLLGRRGPLNVLLGNIGVAVDCFAQAEALYRSCGDAGGQANCSFERASLSLQDRDAVSARPALDQALRLYRRLGAVLGEVNSLIRCSALARLEGDGAEAERLAGDALAQAEKHGWPQEQVAALLELGDALRRQECWDEARDAFGRALAVAGRTENVLGEGEAHRGLGDVAWGEGRAEEARDRWRQALVLFESLPAPHWIARIHVRLARAADATERALHVGQARAIWTSMPFPNRLAHLEREFG